MNSVNLLPVDQLKSHSGCNTYRVELKCLTGSKAEEHALHSVQDFLCSRNQTTESYVLLEKNIYIHKLIKNISIFITYKFEYNFC